MMSGIEVFIVMMVTVAMMCLMLITGFTISFILKGMHLMDDVKKYMEQEREQEKKK